MFRIARSEHNILGAYSRALPLALGKRNSALERLAAVSPIERRTSPLNPGRSALVTAATRQGRRSLDHSSSYWVTLGKRIGLAIDKVIHHDDVILAVIVRTWGGVPCRDPHAGDPSVVINDAEERLIQNQWVTSRL